MVFFFLPFYTCKWICWDTLGNRNYFKLTQLYKNCFELPGLKFACWPGPKERKKNWWENFAVYSSVMQTIQTTMLIEKKHYLAWEWISCYNIANTSQSFHVGHGHSKDGQLVWFAGERATGGHHVTQFIDVRCHLVSPSSLNLTVAFSMKKKREKFINLFLSPQKAQ